MPKAPTYNGPQVNPAQWSGGQLSTNVADMGGFGRGLQSVANMLGQAAEEERRRAESEQITQAFSQANERLTTEMYDPKEGLMYKEGGDLYGVANDRVQAYRDYLKTLADGLSPNARAEFSRGSDSLWQGFNRQVQQRIAHQREKTSGTVLGGYIDSESNAIGTSLLRDPDGVIPVDANGKYDFTQIDGALTRIGLAVKDYTDKDPHGAPEGREGARITMTNKAHREVVPSLVNILLAQGKPEAARQMLERYANAVPLQQQAHAVQAVQAGVARDESLAWTNRILESVTPDPAAVEKEEGKGYTLADQRSYANTLVAEWFPTDAKMRDAVQARIDHEFARREQEHSAQNKDTYEAYATRLERGESFDKIVGESGYWALDKHARDILRESSERTQGRKQSANLGTLYYWESMADSRDPEERQRFMGLNLLDPKLGLNAAEFKELSRRQSQMKRAEIDAVEKQRLDGMLTVHEIAKLAGQDLGYNEKSDDGKIKMAKFKRRLNEEVIAWEKVNKRDAGPQDVQKIADELTLKVAVKGRVYGMKERRLIDLTPAEAVDSKTKVPFENIPESEKKRIVADYKKLNPTKDPTPQDIERLYYKDLQTRRAEREAAGGINFRR